MVFKMTITNIRHDEYGKQEERIVLENANPVSNGTELLQLLQAAAQRGLKKPIPKAPEVPEAAQVNNPPVKRDSINKAFNGAFSALNSLTNASNEPPKKQAQVEGRPKTIDLIGAKSEGFTIAEKIGISQEIEWPEEAEPPVEFTVPDKDDEVQVLIRCQECGYNGTHKTRYGNSYIICRSCLKKLHLERAAEQWGEPDFDGNIYQAQDRYKTAKERWEEKNGKGEDSQ